MENTSVSMLKYANLALAFLLELGVLVALGYWGFQTGQGTIAQIALGIGAPVIAIAVWAVFGAPRSTRRLRGAWLLLLRVVFFGAGAVTLYAAGHHTLGLAFAVVAAVNLILMYAWGQDKG
jgi:hypothetical protein